MTRAVPAWLPLAVLVVVGCARAYPESRRSPPTALAPADAEEIARSEDAQRQLEAQLAQLGAEGAGPDCARICQLRGNICGLADRICAIASRYPSDQTATAHCDDGRARCRSATTAAASRCRCE
jgi:hypothetical protein